jgi:hypothetical protein
LFGEPSSGLAIRPDGTFVQQGNVMRKLNAIGLAGVIAFASLIWSAAPVSAQARKPVTDAMREQCRNQIRAAGLGGRFRPAGQRTQRQILFLNCLARLRKR